MKTTDAVRTRLDHYSTRRLEALTDGVFAIAMTILILDIKVSEFGVVTSSSDLWQELMKNATSLSSFVISFLLLGSMWAVHTRQFEYIEQTDRHMTMLNTIRLLCVVLVPLTTSISGAYQGIVLAHVLLPLNFLLIAVLSYWQWAYATNPKRRYFKQMPQGFMEHSRIRNNAVIGISVLIVISSLFAGQLAFAWFLCMPLMVRLMARTR